MKRNPVENKNKYKMQSEHKNLIPPVLAPERLKRSDLWPVTT